MTWLDLFLATGVAAVGAGTLLVAQWLFKHRNPPPAPAADSPVSGPVFLFQDRTLLDATPDAQEMIAAHLHYMDDYDATLHVLSCHFPDLREKLSGALPDRLRIDGGASNGLWLEVGQTAGCLRLAVKQHQQAGNFTVSDVIERNAQRSELAMLLDMMQNSPQLMWHEDRDGNVLWANRTYLAFYNRLHSAQADHNGANLPRASLFSEGHPNLATRDSTLRRLSVLLPDKQTKQWFDVTSVKRGEGFIHFANDANAVVRADHERRHFVQTLSKTFADLSIGLAIFNKRRELSMFNPALLDMTNLPVEFLSGRPTLDTVLDRLRETRMLPEPKNYTSWRDQFTALEAAAKDGRYTEIWNLPEGQTYRVTGRPHPDGAFAFLFEDISAEMSLTRRFRTDIETGQAVLDTLSDAIAVFSNAGTLVMSNTAYTALWGGIGDGAITPHELYMAANIWQSRCAPTKVWTELCSFIQVLGPRKPWSDRVILDDGRHLRCHADPISGGMTMVRFGFAPPKKPVIQKLNQLDPSLLAAKR